MLAVAPDTDDCESTRRFSALITALHDLRSAAIVRYCRTDDAPPKMGALFPHVLKGQAYFVQVFKNLIEASVLSR